MYNKFNKEICFIKNYLSEYRFNHCIRVAKLMQDLSYIYNLDENKCILTGIFHDVAKEIPLIEMENIMKKNFDNYLSTPVNSWHGFISSYIVEKNFPEIKDKNIYEAIKFHTIGKKNWNILGYTLYICDFCDTEKNNKDLRKKIFEISKSNLYTAILMRIDYTNESLIRRKLSSYISTQEMYEEIKEKYKCYF